MAVSPRQCLPQQWCDPWANVPQGERKWLPVGVSAQEGVSAGSTGVREEMKNGQLGTHSHVMLNKMVLRLSVVSQKPNGPVGLRIRTLFLFYF